MKSLTQYITELPLDEAFRINKDTKIDNYQPKTKGELRELIKKLIDERGKDADLNDIDVSEITDMKDLFEGIDIGNIDISKWDVSNVTSMWGMFFQCKNFNCDISKWNVSKVKDMKWMFTDCRKFNCDLSGWDDRSLKDIGCVNNMFDGCKSLKNNIPEWYYEHTIL